MYKLKAIKNGPKCAVVAFNDSVSEMHFLDPEDGRGFVAHINWVLEGKTDSIWLDGKLGVSSHIGESIYMLSFKVSPEYVKTYLLNKRTLSDFKASLMGALDG